MGYYNDRTDFEKNLAYIINNNTNVALVAGHVNPSDAAGLIASQGDINIVRADIAALAQAVAGMAARVEVVAGRVNTATRPDGSPYMLACQGDVDAVLTRVPSSVLNQQFKLADGTVTNLAGILTAIHAKPVSAAAAGPATTDVQAVAEAVAATLSQKLGK